jgi:hypothetical protein
MGKEIKTLDGVMNLDDSNDVLPLNNHREARNGVFKGNAPEMHFTAIRGNVKVNNTSIFTNDCRLVGSALFIPNCSLVGTAVYVPKCELVGTAVWIPEPITMTTTISCTAYIGSGKIVVGSFAGGWKSFSFIAISTVSAADALSRLDASGTRFALTTSSYTFQNLANATYYIAIMDTGGLKGSTSATIACEPEPVSCILNHVCDEFTGSSTVRAKTFTGGGGTFQITNQLYTTAAAAIAGTFVDVTTTTVEYTNVVDGTYYVGLRDKANTANKVAISIISDCVLAGDCSCFTVTNTTANKLDVTFFACNGSPSSRVVEGTIWICVAGGTTPPAVTGLTITRCDPAVPCTTNLTCFECGDTTPEWVDQSYNVCIECISYDVYKDINPNSESYNKFKINGVIDTIEPEASICNTTADYSEEVGTYYRCSAGTTLSDTVYKNTATCFVGNQYKAGTVTYATDPTNTIPDTDPILTDQGYNTCYQCADKLVYKNTNACSPFYNYYYVNGDRLTTTEPPAGLCPTVANWVDLNFKTCYGCEELQVYQNQAICVTNSYKYRIGGAGGVVVDTIPSNTLCNYAANWVLTGYNTCSSCTNYAVYRDTNGCSDTYNKYRVNNVVVGLTEPTRGNCSTTANWQNFGSRVCIDCTSYQPQKDMNPCSATANNIRNVDGVLGAAPCNTTTPSYTSASGTFYYCSDGTVNSVAILGNTNACYSEMATAQFRADFGGGNYIYYGLNDNPANSSPSTTANWINLLPVETYYECEGNIRYNQQQDINACSPTGGQTRRGTEFGIVAGYCGYNPVTCTSYDVYNPDSNYDLSVSYEQCGGTTVYDSVGPGQTMNVCAVENTVSIGGSGDVTNVGSCSA